MIRWFETHEVVLWWLTAGSAVAFAASLVVIPLWIVRIPPDFFAPPRRRGRRRASRRHPAVRVSALIAKNALGGVLVLLGIALLVLPGQGLLTIFVGVMILDFPGKYRFQRWVVTRPAVLRPVNALRRRAGRPPLVFVRNAADRPSPTA